MRAFGPPRRPVKAILFDKDGTLFDFNATWVVFAEAMIARFAGADRGLAARLAAAIAFDPAARRFRPGSVVIAGTPEDAARVLAPHLDLAPADLTEVINAEAAKAPQAEAVPLAALLAELKGRGLALGVATNDAEIPARAHLTAAGVLADFDFIAGSDSGFGDKPAPGMCLGFAAALGLDPAGVVMVGDSLHDLHAGRAAGMMTLGVLTGPAGAAELAPHADAVLPDIGHLPRWLGS